jgi:hypothetical protein
MSEVKDLSDTAAGAAPCEEAPTREQRLALVRGYQAEALRRQDPLAANLGVLSGDLVGLAHGFAELVKEGLAQGPAADRQRLYRDAELHLKYVRQIDRLAQMERRPPPRGAGGAWRADG